MNDAIQKTPKSRHRNPEPLRPAGPGIPLLRTSDYKRFVHSSTGEGAYQESDDTHNDEFCPVHSITAMPSVEIITNGTEVYVGVNLNRKKRA